MPAEQVDELRRVVAGGEAESVSSYVAAAVRDRLARDQALARLREAWGELPDDALTWARRTLGVAGDETTPAKAAS